jgi:ketosteroid isomerase-like protein
MAASISAVQMAKFAFRPGDEGILTSGRTLGKAREDDMHDDLRHEVEAIGSAYSEHFNRQDAAGIAALFADGGVHINPAGPRTDIAEFYRGLFKAGLNFQESSVDEVCPVGAEAAVAIGQFRTTGTDQSGALIEIKGFSTATYVREGGKWKIRMLSAIPKLQAK